MKFWVRMMAPEELAYYVMGADGKDRCRIAFLAKEYAADERGLHLNGTIVWIVEVFYPTMKTDLLIISTTAIAAMLLEKSLNIPHNTIR